MTTPDPNLATQAIDRFIIALNRHGDAAAVADAVSDDACIERGGVGDLAGTVVELIRGRANVGRWMALSPPLTTFTRQGTVTPEVAPGWQVGYRITIETFENTGHWRFTLDDAGRIARLRHDPDPLHEVTVSEVRDPAETWRDYQRPLPVHHHAGHAHDAPHSHDDHDH